MLSGSKSKPNLNTNRDNKNAKQTYMGKVIVLGNSSVGKTSILTRYTWNGQGVYQLSHTPTIGVDFKSKTIDLKTAIMKLQLWDTAGQQRFRTLTDNYYSGASGIVLVYSVTDRKSFQQIADWMYQINSKTDQDTVKILLANKCDVSGRNSISSTNDDKRVVEAYEGKMLADKYKAMFMEVSAKENINIQQAFTTLASKMLEKFINDPNRSTNAVLVLDKKKSQDKSVMQKKMCC